MSLSNVFGISASALTAQSMRLNATASNLANAESITGPNGKPYRAKQVYFQPTEVTANNQNFQGVQVSKVLESDALPKLEYNPSSPYANEKGFVEKSNVNVIEETTNMISASRSYEQNIDVMNNAKNMMLKALEIGR